MEIVLNKTSFLDVPIQVEPMHGVIFSNENKGHKFVITGIRGGELQTFAGSVIARFIRANNTTILMGEGAEGELAACATIEDGKVSVSLARDCYNVPGRFQLTVFVTNEGETSCVYAAVGTVQRSENGTLIDDGVALPSVDELQSMLDEIQQYETNIATAGAAQIAAVQAKGEETLDSIPDDYTALQGEVDDLKSAINTLYMCKIPLESGGWSSNGNTKSVMISRLRNVYPISREVFKSITLPQGYSASGYTLDENYTKLGTLSYSNSHDLSGMAQNVKYINLSIRKDDSASSDISSYCDTVQSGTVAVLIDSYNISALQTGVTDLQSGALQYRGSISDLGYTSVAQCTKTGFYNFLSSDVASLSDLPTGWTSGGYIFVYKLPNGAWQYIGNNRNRYIRSGLSGVWYPDVMVDATLTKADVAADAKATGDVFRYLNVLKRRKLVYNVASYAKSNARLRIYIPQESGYLLIDMRHYYYNNDTGKADCWGIDNAFACDNNRTQLFQITNGGEWECAVRIKDGQDFSGGGTHGDERNAVTTFFIDGMPVDITTYTSVTDFKELRIVQESELYTPTENGNQTKIATHGTEWIYTENGVKISQYLKWEPSVNIAIAYMCMFPVAKTSSYNDGTIKIVDRIFTDTGYDVYTPTNNTSKRWQGASVVDAYCTESKVHCKISPIEYVKNLTGGNVVSETDNGGLNYFKLYWPVVNSGDYTVTGHTTESGELWKSVVEYSISLT